MTELLTEVPKIFSNALQVHHISKGVERTKKYIEERKAGVVNPLKTFSNKLNNILEGGVEWQRILTIAGLSGSGKSIALEQLKRSFLENHKDIAILSFEFEMMIEDQILRRVSADANVGAKDPIKGKIDATNLMDGYASENLFFVDKIGSVAEIAATVRNFITFLPPEIGLLVTVDHSVLTKGKQGESEKVIVDDLMHTLVELKKEFGETGRRCTFVVLSQLNRDIEDSNRVLNPFLHYPTKNDIFCSSAVYYSSDYVIITHKPKDINGIHQYYGPPLVPRFPQGLPVICPTQENKAMIYWHLIKDRFGERAILPFVEDFKHSKVIEYEFQK